MIARLNNEKAVREDLEKQRKELLMKKQSLIAENKKRKEDLASLDEQLKKFSTHPINLSPRMIELADQCVQLRFVVLLSTTLYFDILTISQSSRPIQTTFQKDY